MAHGVYPDALSANDWQNVVILYADGLIGNMRILETLGMLTAGVYNQWLPKGYVPYRLYDFVPSLKAYHPKREMTGDEVAQNVELFFKMMGAKLG